MHEDVSKLNCVQGGREASEASPLCAQLASALCTLAELRLTSASDLEEIADECEALLKEVSCPQQSHCQLRCLAWLMWHRWVESSPNGQAVLVHHYSLQWSVWTIQAQLNIGKTTFAVVAIVPGGELIRLHVATAWH
jgi:hypothetical protein